MVQQIKTIDSEAFTDEWLADEESDEQECSGMNYYVLAAAFTIALIAHIWLIIYSKN